jgi:hypothetical protein
MEMVSVASKSKTRKVKSTVAFLRIVKFIASLLSSFGDEEKISHKNTRVGFRVDLEREVGYRL